MALTGKLIRTNALALLCFIATDIVVLALNYDECVAPLGMESELIADDQIKASSSYDDASVGPQNARVGHEDGGGAWCPRQQVKKDVYEFLEVDLLQLHVVSSVETQGRFGNGQGQEFAEQFMLEYQREPDSEWITFRNRKGEKLFRGNTNTYVRNNQKLDPPIIARKIRFIPQSVYARTVCMRVELFGCPWREGILWYSMPQGESKAPDVQLYDWSYDGVIESNHLYLGMGQLTDGRLGADNFRGTTVAGQKASDWVGWKNDSHRGSKIDLTFKFDVPRKFSAMYLYCNNLFSKDVQVFATASIYFSIGGKYYTGAPVHYAYTADTVMEKSRNVSIKLNQHVGRYVKVILTFASRWMMISEVSFDSEPLAGNFTPEASPPELLTKSTTSSAALDGQFFHIFHPSGFLLGGRDAPEVHGHKTHLYAVQGNTSSRLQPTTTDDYVGLIIGIVSGMVILLLIGLGIVLLRFRHRKHHYRNKFHSAADFFSLEKNLPFDLKNVQVETLRSINGNMYGSVASEEPEKNTIYHEPHEVILKRILPEMPSSALIKEYHNTLCSREYAIPELKSPYVKPKNFAGNHLLPCYNQFSLQGPSGTNSMDSPTCSVQPTMSTVSELPRSCLKFIERIGEGQFGEVHLCVAEDLYELTGYRSMSPSAKLVAVKMLRSDVSGDIKSDFRREIEILSTLHDPNLIQVLGVCTQEDPLCMVVEYMECGDLNQFLKEHMPESPSGLLHQKALNYGTLIYMASQIASGMKYLENLNYVHRDLATRNCLVGQNYTIKVSDFGMSRRLYACDYYRIEGKAILPIRWMAWESILMGKFTTKSDVWSFAVTLWEILTFAREQPFEELNDEQVIENAGSCYQGDKKTILLAQPHLCPKEIYDLMRECWQKQEENRPNFREIHLFLQRKNLGYTLER
ncbi:discoidin domain-containing receptor 2-like [Paramacrobiotus metropolitanus]|uniref:discoidin domain-containing receptor 2-like n=1 Tax=Paramacrobiotus metropolitanus TaxID=2943436 RepID=UPI0024461BAC|nr:discoidin domain-containing receptor 2-like [Paramacrobiotus metropolitanus]XP_055335648.1 discoidin domain-containing receptor 2-like [Paramacrobiotus metropolitanus]XP_055335658.1 discoidin domain-containing receptor 2-like [Paramacrobiotus metropolitanus]XP_055335665.1 discoidin domain-containing receptor 2-like [Paramacrobiotus metropolitanus]